MQKGTLGFTQYSQEQKGFRSKKQSMTLMSHDIRESSALKNCRY